MAQSAQYHQDNSGHDTMSTLLFQMSWAVPGHRRLESFLRPQVRAAPSGQHQMTGPQAPCKRCPNRSQLKTANAQELQDMHWDDPPAYVHLCDRSEQRLQWPVSSGASLTRAKLSFEILCTRTLAKGTTLIERSHQGSYQSTQKMLCNLLTLLCC